MYMHVAMGPRIKKSEMIDAHIYPPAQIRRNSNLVELYMCRAR